jgi:hypothetical protein
VASEEQLTSDFSSSFNQEIPLDSVPSTFLSTIGPTDDPLQDVNDQIHSGDWSLDQPKQWMNDSLVIGQSPEWPIYAQNLTFTETDGQPAPGDAFTASVSHAQMFRFDS